uniref:SnoaL-like domain-containing protein n=1 Tax=Zooxanthella nutricula TaxID=1333877 RepID=A0A7S2PVG7_9DINO|mmetsp:Transcript_68301/g.209486  ORF Transcript_68301/g.209486 Transcript_68301/m.209486 type:complete len:148 (+) Transcript_68301:116-559(+)|eukprot:CAMPEP_0198503236 /NCGR_PEP_ID=MMETSP1462-20131121/9777_1 /TAXON_ID=1333877 /ORGANISM="Brandtodinium nutriculum, Strain RCC3387" /LENGTH=147 /DNA_ID=CAMNT_0044232347 /DNA_START=110 /DNA_END=553 /DNA_ORIENTATION=+
MVPLSQERRETVERLFNSFSLGRAIEVCDEILADNAIWEVAPRTVTARRSKSEHLAYLGPILDDYTEFSITPNDILVSSSQSESDILYCAARSACTHRLLGAYGQDYIFCFWFAPGSGNKIVYVKEYVDTWYSIRFFNKAEKAKAKL